MNFPAFDTELQELNQFILMLVQEYNNGNINSWNKLDEKVKAFYTAERMDDIEAKAQGWKKMSSYSDGITLTHVTCVFLGMFMLPEFQALSAEKKQIAKWTILFHDIDKFHIRGKKDTMHAFNSAVVAANTLPKLGFPIQDTYLDPISSWSSYTRQAFVTSDNDTAPKPDNQKLPKILSDIDRFFGEDTPAALIIKTVLLHISLDADKNYPTPSPLTETEIRQFISLYLLPLLKVMMLADNEGWSLFEPETREQQNRDMLKAFKRVEQIIEKEKHKETVKKGYNEIADRYLAERDRDTENVQLLNDFIELLAPKSKVLDAGCGAGIPITHMLAEYFDVIGVDFSEAQIEIAKKNVPNAHFFCQDMTELDFPDDSLDGICSYYAIIHIPREEHALLFANFHRMLRSNGAALLCLGAEDLVDDIEEDFLGTRMYWSHYNSNTYLKMLKEGGFSIIWAKHIKDETCEGAKHLFVLAQKKAQ